MATLLLRLVGPLQSWGVQSHFTHRDTGLEPSKSGVIGLVCAALGKPRDETHPANADKPALAALAALRMGVRVDREGLVKRDYHTAQNIMKAGGSPFAGLKGTELSERFYLADAGFLVGLEGDADLLRQIEYRLRRPIWMLYLGRKSFVASEPIWLKHGLRLDQSLEDALRGENHGLRIADSRTADERTRLVIEDPNGSIVRPDQPLSFERDHRRFTVRRVRMEFCTLPATPKEESPCTFPS